MAECGTHAIVAAEAGKAGKGEETLARRIFSGGAAGPGMAVIADAGLYSYEHFRLVIDVGVDAMFRVGAGISLPVLEWLPDCSCISWITEPGERNKHQRRLKAGRMEATEMPGTCVRVVDYEVAGRGDRDEIITLVTP